MGRRSVPLSEADRWVFRRLADAYRSRPPYPAALADRLAELARAAADPGPAAAAAAVADLGAGTGDLALPLARRGLRVAAVEPAREMLDVLEERARAGAAAPGAVDPVHATAERTGLPGRAFSLVLLADAAQWVDPELAGAEASRLLAPGGAVAVVQARFAATPFMDGLAALLARANPRARPRPEGPVRQLLALGARGGAPREEAFLQEAELDGAGLRALLRSLSFAGPALGPGALERLGDEAEALAAASGGARFRRDLTLRWAAAPRPRRRGPA